MLSSRVRQDGPVLPVSPAIGVSRLHMRIGSLTSCWTVIGGRAPTRLRGWTWGPFMSTSWIQACSPRKCAKRKIFLSIKQQAKPSCLAARKGHWLLPRWWIYRQVIQVFEQSKRSVPVFNDKHLSYNWDDAKWMFDKSRELNFPLTGGSSIPAYFRKPEIEMAADTPIKNSIVVGGAVDEGAIFHCVDVLQAFVDRRKGGETGVRSVQSIRGSETWKWVESTSWASNLLEAVRKNFDL